MRCVLEGIVDTICHRVAALPPMTSTMNYWNSLSLAVENSIQTGRGGSPVFARWTAAAAVEEVALQSLVTGMARCVSAWFSASPCRVYALQSQSHDHLTLSLEFPHGAAAVLSVAQAHGRPESHLFVLGSQGAIYHDEQVGPAAGLDLSLPPSWKDPNLFSAVEQSLCFGNPVSVSISSK